MAIESQNQKECTWKTCAGKKVSLGLSSGGTKNFWLAGKCIKTNNNTGEGGYKCANCNDVYQGSSFMPSPTTCSNLTHIGKTGNQKSGEVVEYPTMHPKYDGNYPQDLMCMYSRDSDVIAGNTTRVTCSTDVIGEARDAIGELTGSFCGTCVTAINMCTSPSYYNSGCLSYSLASCNGFNDNDKCADVDAVSKVFCERNHCFQKMINAEGTGGYFNVTIAGTPNCQDSDDNGWCEYKN
jgi:hypothetical protein